MMFITGLVMVLLLPRKTFALSEALRSKPAETLGWGALILFVTPIVALVVFITIVGIPLSLITITLWGITLYLAEIPVGIVIGRLILRQPRFNSRGQMVGSLALGLFILMLIKLIPVIDWVITLFIILFGAGTIITVLKHKEVFDSTLPKTGS
jgi:hypothetical protein